MKREWKRPLLKPPVKNRPLGKIPGKCYELSGLAFSNPLGFTSRGLVVVEGDSIAKAGLEVVLVEATGNQAAAHRG